MFFKRLTKNKPATTTPATEAPRTDSTIAQAEAPAVQPLAADKLRRSVDAKGLGFKTTADLKPAANLIGQERALEAIDFGLAMKARDFNIFVLGPPACGKSTVVRAHLAKVAAASNTPSDWVYVHNFEDPRRPRALALPAGRAAALSRGVSAALAEIAVALPAAFRSEDYVARSRAIEETFRASQEDALDDLYGKAAQQNIAVLRTPLGFSMAPMHDGKIVRPEVFNQLPETMRRDVETRVKALEAALERILADAPKADKHRRQQLAALNEEAARPVIEDALDDISKAFADVAEAAAFLAEVERDLVAHASAFAADVGTARSAAAPTAQALASDSRLNRYLVNVLVAQAGEKAGAPVVELPHPTVSALLGSVDRAASHGAEVLAIRPGALARANGGALVIDAKDLMHTPAAWTALKRALKSGEIRFEAEEPATPGAAPRAAIEPEPIPLLIKVLLLGEAELFHELQQVDGEFASLFKVQADFDETLARGKDNDNAYARLVASVIETHGLKPIDASGVAKLMEESQRMAEDRDKLTIEVGRIADLVREADYWSDAASRKTTTGDDVLRAIKERAHRADRARANSHDSVARGILLVDTSGAKPGQVNALSLAQKGGSCFGRPARITARAHLGPGRVTDIEREVALGGPLHSKGVMILWGFLAGRFAQEIPLALAATLVFEQSYETVEGDSASLAELLALLSALADAPLRQDLAVTGSINQWGEVQAVGGVNEKIEGFFDVCAARGLSGSQGVVIPAANTQHLMLREDVVAAVREKKFSVYAVTTVDEAAALLAGIEAGPRNGDGRFASESLNGRVEAKLRAYAERSRAYAGQKPADAAPVRS
jgi:predicted ATP-dependent protease